MCTRSRYLLNKLKFFTNKKNFFANYFLILGLGLLNKISIFFFISGLIKFLKIWVPNRTEIEILLYKQGPRNKIYFMKKIKLLVKNLSYCSKNHANSQDGTRMNPNFTPKCFYWYVVFKNISHVCIIWTLILSISSSSVNVAFEF